MTRLSIFQYLEQYKTNNSKVSLYCYTPQDINMFHDFKYIGFIDNFNYKTNKAFLFKENCTEQEYKEITSNLVSFKKDFTIILYNKETKVLILEIKSKNLLKVITIKGRKNGK